MATRQNYIEYVCEQISGVGVVRYLIRDSNSSA